MNEPCCEANDYGFPCGCLKNRYYEDDGYGDWLYDRMRDEQMERELEDEI